MRKYIHCTQKNPVGYLPDGTPVALEWMLISPNTQDASLRASMPGEYAMMGDVVYVVSHVRPEKPKKLFKGRRR